MNWLVSQYGFPQNSKGRFVQWRWWPCYLVSRLPPRERHVKRPALFRSLSPGKAVLHGEDFLLAFDFAPKFLFRWKIR